MISAHFGHQLVDLALAALGWISVEKPPASVIEIMASELKAGMVLAEDLYDSSGVFLGHKGVTIRDNMLPRMRRVIGVRKIKISID